MSECERIKEQSEKRRPIQGCKTRRTFKKNGELLLKQGGCLLSDCIVFKYGKRLHKVLPPALVMDIGSTRVALTSYPAPKVIADLNGDKAQLSISRLVIHCKPLSAEAAGREDGVEHLSWLERESDDLRGSVYIWTRHCA